MENKKTLEIKAALCDVRHVTEELLSAYEKVQIKASTLITSSAAQALLGRYGVQLSCANTLTVEDDVSFSTINGPLTISAGQTMPDKKLCVSVNGPLTLEPGCEEVLKSYVSMTINGPVRCPASMTPLLASFGINGPVQSYPDGAVILKSTAILDRVFHLRAKQDALYYAPSRIVALAPDVSFEKLAGKNIRFTTKTLLVSESLAEAAVPLFDEKVDIEILPDGCAYVDGDAELDESLLKRYGGKLYINGGLTVGPDSAGALDQISFLKINGDLIVCQSLRDRVLEMDIDYSGLYVVGELLISGRAQVEINAAMLENAAGGISVISCASVDIAGDVTLELLREKLVSIADCASVTCAAKEQLGVIQTLSQDVASFSLSDEAAGAEEEEADDRNTVRIHASSYTL